MSADEYKNEGNEKYKAKDYPGAIEWYTKAIALDNQNASLFTNRAAAHLMVLHYKEAADDCDAALLIDNTNSKAYFRKVSALKGMGRVDDAIQCITQGLVHDPNNATALREKESLLNVKVRLEDVARMVREQKKFRMALPKIDELLRELGSSSRNLNLMKVECLVETRRLEEALNLSNAIMRTSFNGDVELLFLRARCLQLMGDIENAFKHLQQAMRSDPDNSKVRTEFKRVKEMEATKDRGNTAFREGRYEDALEAWKECINIDPENKLFISKIHSNRANALAKLKRHEEAVEECTLALRANKDNAKALMRRAECNYALGGEERLQQALKDYETLQESSDDGPDMSSKIKQTKNAIRMSKRKDLYKILGVTRDASLDEIKKAYKKSALKFHPDKQGGKSDAEKQQADAKFKAVGEAYEILSDPEKKQRYDSGVDVEDIDNPHAGHGGFGGHGHGGGIDPNILFQMFMQQQGGGMGGMRFG